MSPPYVLQNTLACVRYKGGSRRLRLTGCSVKKVWLGERCLMEITAPRVFDTKYHGVVGTSQLRSCLIEDTMAEGRWCRETTHLEIGGGSVYLDRFDQQLTLRYQ